MTDTAIRVNNLGKCYQIYDTPRDRLKQFVVPRLQRLAEIVKTSILVIVTHSPTLVQ